jgi:hypothetical protein
VALVQLPSQLQEAVRLKLGNARDLEISEVESTIEALMGARARDFDAAIVRMGNDVPSLARSMVEVNSALKVVMLSSDATVAYLYALHPRMLPIPDVDGPGLAKAIRDAVWPEVA